MARSTTDPHGPDPPKPIPRIQLSDTAVIVVDMQEKLLPTIVDGSRILNNTIVLVKAAAELGLPVLVTEHYPQGLGRTDPALAAAMLDPSSRVEKTRFSAVVDLVDELLHSWRRSSVLVCGIEAHVCVLQTALDLQASGRQAFPVSDAISASQRDQIPPARRRWERAGAVTTGVMAAMYELLGDADHPSRRVCVDLAKRIQA